MALNQGAFNVDNSKELKHISLCAGYGGIDLGLSRALGSIRTVCFVEIEAFAIQNLVAKIEKGFLDQAPIFTNLKTFHWELFHGKVDILSGGFPCQPFSAAGRRKGSEDPRHLWPYITDGIKRLGRPPIVFFENVEGIISSKLKGSDWRDREGTSVLLHVLRELERLGYKATAGVFSASEVGAPHQRKRVFILGVRNDLRQKGFDAVNKLIKQNKSIIELGHTESKQDHSGEIRDLEKTSGQRPSGNNAIRTTSRSRTAWPASRGQNQYCYEPPRVTMGDSNGRNKESHGVKHRILHSETEYRKASGLERKIESSLGGNVDGTSDWMDHAKLFESCDNRTDELRLLGNGVVPDTASKAFKTLWYKINQL